MSRRRIGQETFGFANDLDRSSSLGDLLKLVSWMSVDQGLDTISCAAKGEPAWPPLALFKALLLSIWYDLSDVKLAEALDDQASFRRFCGFSRSEPTPEQTAFVRFRKALVAHSLDKTLFDEVARQLKAKAIQVKTGTLVDATIIASASEDVTGSSTKAAQRFMASRLMSVPTPIRLLSRKSQSRLPTSMTVRLVLMHCRRTLRRLCR